MRRRAWINSSRQWVTLEEPEGPLGTLPSASIADDDVFSDGYLTGKIENWLLGCGSDACSEKSGQLSFESVRQASNFADDLSLGADASGLHGGEATSEPSLARQPSFKQHSRLASTPRQGLCLPSLNLGHSIASSCLSSSTWKSTSTVSEVLELRSEDAEETLYELGFGCEEPQVTVRIPPRFFTFPSQAQGINFRLFLDSQIRRIREEDPSLSLASRFRQVQVLTAMANAFYSLYSHVSRTPLQKLSTPEFTFSSPVERIERFRSSIRSEPRSPVERLKDTVNKMCLYTGTPRGSDSTSPQPSPRKRSSLPDVIDVVWKVKTGVNKKLDLEECNGNNSAMDVRPITDDANGQETQQSTDTDILKNRNKTYQKQMEDDNKQADNVDPNENNIKLTDPDCMTQSVRTSVASSLSEETVIETQYESLPCQPEPGSCLTQSDKRTAELKLAAKVTYDSICPQIVESVHRAPFCCQSTRSLESLTYILSESESTGRSCSGSQKSSMQTSMTKPSGDSGRDNFASSGEATQDDSSRSLPVLEPSGSYSHYCITVTGWEDDAVSSSSLKTPDYNHASQISYAEKHKKSVSEKQGQYLNPLMHQALGKFSSKLQQVNSFELEEVHSAGEEDFGQSETSRTTTSPFSKKHQSKGEVVRGDSMQSDSSGYADEEVSPSSDRHSR